MNELLHASRISLIAKLIDESTANMLHGPVSFPELRPTRQEISTLKWSGRNFAPQVPCPCRGLPRIIPIKNRRASPRPGCFMPACSHKQAWFANSHKKTPRIASRGLD